MKRFPFLTSLFVVALAVLAIPVFTGCGDDPVEPEPAAMAKVRFVHAATAANIAVDVLVDGAAFINNRSYGDATSYLNIEAGSKEIQVVPTGTTTAAATGTLVFEADKNYTLFAVNEADDSFVFILVEDDLTEPEAGKYHIRFINLVSDSPVLKVGIAQVGAIFNDVAFKQGTNFIDRDEAAPTFNVQDATVGGGGSQGGDPPLFFRSFGLEVGKIYTLYGQGLLGDTGDLEAKLELLVHN